MPEYWGLGFYCKRNGNIVMNSVAAHRDRRVICSKDAFLSW